MWRNPGRTGEGEAPGGRHEKIKLIFWPVSFFEGWGSCGWQVNFSLERQHSKSASKMTDDCELFRRGYGTLPIWEEKVKIKDL